MGRREKHPTPMYVKGGFEISGVTRAIITTKEMASAMLTSPVPLAPQEVSAWDAEGGLL